MTQDKKSKEPARRLQLRESHSVYQKIEQLLAKCEELGIQISFSNYATYVTDTNYPNIIFELEYLDSKNPVDSFPVELDFKIVLDNSEWIEYHKQERERKDAELKAKKEAEKRTEEEKRKAAEARKAEALRQKELAELARLKAKYEKNS